MAATRRTWNRVQADYEAWLQTRPPAVPVIEVAPEAPLLSVIMPVHDVDAALLEAAIVSVFEQTYPKWELCIADDASTREHIRQILGRYAGQDPRVHVAYRAVPGHIAAASNTALSLASGEFIVLLDHDDLLAPQALDRVAGTVLQDAQVDFVYSDEDKIDMEGRRTQPFFKPSWSPTLLTSCNYITHLAALRRSLVEEVGDFRETMTGSQDYDLFLRVTERARKVAHIPDVLYSWRMAPGSTARASSAKPYAIDASRRALSDMVMRRGLNAVVEESTLNGIFLTRYPLDLPVSISLVVEGAGSAWQRLLRWRELRVADMVFLHGGAPLQRPVRVVESIEELSGDFMVWVDAASRPCGARSVLALLEALTAPDVAVTGGTTRLPDGTILQAGITMGENGQPVYAYAGLPSLPQPNFYLNLKDLPHEVSNVYSGCAAMRRETWRNLKGWDTSMCPELALSDLCLRASHQGYRTVYTPQARFERRDRLPPLPSIGSVAWPWIDYIDPYWNENLRAGSPDGLPLHGGREVNIHISPGTQSPCPSLS